jgi:polysaccharide pyruvyl transferase WcaK-like protein/sulfatase maturation enzyme AslB (radical SAM superfamily)
MWIKLILAGLKNEALNKMNVQRKPTVINYSLTNTCNCKCLMCNIWEAEHRCQKELTAAEIGVIFSSDFYQSIRHIGISGGEPFLRNDIIEVVENITDSIKSLHSLSFISNGTLGERINNTVPLLIEICKKKGIEFNISFSIDGVGVKHNEIRGHKDAFKKLENLLNLLDDKKIDYSFSTTIIKQNIDNLFDILNYADERGKIVNFRLASKIDRLFNENLKFNFDFTLDERMKISKFLEGVMVKYEKRRSKKLFYFSLIKQLTENEKRRSGCLWKNQGISLDPEGNMYYCFVKSPKIGNVREDESKSLYFGNKKVLKRINRDYCDKCYHDYGGLDSPKLIIDYLLFSIEKIFRYSFFSKCIYFISGPATKILKGRKSKIGFKNNAYITGWYGTETLGDKAILAGIIKIIQRLNSQTHFSISSYVPYHTEETMLAIPTNSNTVLGKKFKDKVKAIKDSQIVILGGGPLMDILDINDVLFEFIIAKILNKKTMIFGSGLGPIKDPGLEKIIRRILELSEVIILRDEKGSLKYSKLLEGLNYKSIIDPSVAYLREFKTSKEKHSDFLLMCIRDWPEVYCDTNTNYNETKEKYENSIVEIINLLIDKGENIVLFPMHTYYIGDDDRYFFNRIAKKVNRVELDIYNRDYVMDEGIDVFLSAKAVIGMRFHSVVFGNALEKPTLALDYDTKKGKIFGFVSLINSIESYINIKNMDSNNIVDIYEELLNNHENKKHEISRILDNKVKELHEYIYINMDAGNNQ